MVGNEVFLFYVFLVSFIMTSDVLDVMLRIQDRITKRHWGFELSRLGTLLTRPGAVTHSTTALGSCKRRVLQVGDVIDLDLILS